MSFKCVICGKKPVKGKTISHSHRNYPYVQAEPETPENGS